MTTRLFRGTFGAAVEQDGTTFCLWAPAVRKAVLSVRDARGDREIAMEAASEGWFRASDPQAAAGSRYAFLLDDDEMRYPDPASRSQPDGVHGDSMVVDPTAFAWPESAWEAGPWREQIVYELHLGTFTPEGTLAAAESKLPYLAELGVTALELMPLSQAPGSRNWGYDGVMPYAPNVIYGAPDDVKHFIAEAHRHGLAVYHDVVYNHFGPEGSYLHRIAPQFFTERHTTPWGAAIDFTAPHNDPVRDFFIENAIYWLTEYGFDGLRFDATQCIYDERTPSILIELLTRVRERAGHTVHLIVENDLNQIFLQYAGFDAQWNDDVHHCVHVLITGETGGYYVDYGGHPERMLAKALATGYGYQGERSVLRGGDHRGSPSEGVALSHFVNFLSNHDQIGNRPFGERIGRLAEPAALRAGLATVFLAPSVPMLFMGDEWNASAPFEFFCDFEPDLARAVREGREREFASFSAMIEGETVPDATLLETFERCRLDWQESATGEHAETLAFVKELFATRKREIVPLLGPIDKARVAEGGPAAEGSRAIRVRWSLGEDAGDLELLANLTAEPDAVGPPTRGTRVLFTAGEPRDGESLPAWSVEWSVRAPVPEAAP